ncbi:MAG: cysteine--tRNA ligase, partial [Ruminococcus sp.]|nr:cysteine--tRNA ligase [Ruminococcus sp.]
TVKLLEEKGYAPVVYRFFCLLSHYRKSLVFSWENLDNAKTAYNKILARVAALQKEPAGEVDKAAYDELMGKFTEALDNDINTSNAVTALYDVLKADTTPASKLKLLDEFDKVLSLDITANAKKQTEQDESTELPAEVAELVSQRADARKAKNFALADELRDKITALGYKIEETRQGTKITKL